MHAYNGPQGTLFRYNSHGSGDVTISIFRGGHVCEIDVPAEDIREFVAECFLIPGFAEKIETAIKNAVAPEAAPEGAPPPPLGPMFREGDMVGIDRGGNYVNMSRHPLRGMPLPGDDLTKPNFGR